MSRKFYRQAALAGAILAAGLAALYQSPAVPGTERGMPAGPSREAAVLVRRVVDGDTVLLASGEYVRYIGIDTPELHHPHKPVQPYAREAAEFNRQLVGDKKILLEYDVQHRDRFNRLLAYVYLEDGTFVNAELMRHGYAQLLTIPPNVKHVELFTRLQKEAREAGRGLWGNK